MNEANKEVRPAKEILTEVDRENLRKMLENISTFASEMNKKIQHTVGAVEEFARQNAPVIATIVKSLNQMPNDFSAIQKTLAERGWFFLTEMPASDYRSLKSLIDDSKFDDLDKTMSAWTLHLLDETEKKLCDLFPDREALLREGFDNHRKGKYASAITLLLTQSDGLCFDSLKMIFFKERQEKGGIRVTGIKTELEALGIDGFTKIILHPVLTVSGINANEEQIRNGEFPNSPHRNPILHGKVTDYASELNSLKIISLVGFMGGVVHTIVEEAKKSVASPISATTP